MVHPRGVAAGRHRVATSATNSAQAPARCACAACSSAAALNARAWRTALRTASLCASLPGDDDSRNPFPKPVPRASRLEFSKSRAPSAGTLTMASPRDVTSKHPPAAAGRRSDRSASAPSAARAARVSSADAPWADEHSAARNASSSRAAAVSGGRGGAGMVASVSSAASRGFSTAARLKWSSACSANAAAGSASDRVAARASAAASGGRSSSVSNGTDALERLLIGAQ